MISKLQRKIDKDGYQVVPLLSDLWKKNQNANLMSTATVTSHIMDLRRIDQLVDNLEYNGVLDFIAGVQLMLQNVVKFCNYSYEVCSFHFYLMNEIKFQKSCKTLAGIYEILVND